MASLATDTTKKNQKTTSNVTVKLLSKKEQYSEADESEDEDDKDPSPFGTRGEYRNHHHIEAEIKYGDKIVGKMTGNLLERPYGAFQEVCDCESSELNKIGVTFFGDSGRTTVKSIRNAELPESKNWGTMPFLHISSLKIYGKSRKTYQPPSDLLLTQYFKLDQKHTRSLAFAMDCVLSYIINDSKTLGRLQQTCKAYGECEEEALRKQRKSFFMANGLRGLLLNTKLADNWGLAMYIPDWMPEERAWKKSIGIDRLAKLTDEQHVTRNAVIIEAVKADTCGFFRCGF